MTEVERYAAQSRRLIAIGDEWRGKYETSTTAAEREVADLARRMTATAHRMLTATVTRDDAGGGSD